MRTHKLNFGEIPALGLGTWQMDDETATSAVAEAIKLGYRHIDCAAIYQNEVGVGAGIKQAIKAGVSRDSLWITSKLWNDCHRAEHVEPALKKTLGDLGLDYLDLYLIHWPVVHQPGIPRPETADDFLSLQDVPILETWQAMEACAAKGLCRDIGVSNFSVKKLSELLPQATVKPSVNQVECHPLLTQTALKSYCDENGIRLIAYSPLGSGDRPETMVRDNEPNLFEQSEVIAIAEARGVTVPQVLLAWAVNRGTVVIPKSKTPKYMQENLAAAEIKLTQEESDRIDALDSHFRFVDGKFWERPGGIYTVENLWDE